MKVLDLFSGLGGWSKAFSDRGHDVHTVDIDPKFNPTYVRDLLSMAPKDVKGYDIILASPPCECFSVMRIGQNWTRDHKPRNERARKMMELALHSFDILKDLPYVLENPRAKLRKLSPYPPTVTIWYCQYGDYRAKPTDIWTTIKELKWRPECRNGNPDCHHERARRGTKKGTMRPTDRETRALIPYDLSLDICLQMENILKSRS